jgi:hypothetical protein
VKAATRNQTSTKFKNPPNKTRQTAKNRPKLLTPNTRTKPKATQKENEAPIKQPKISISFP